MTATPPPAGARFAASLLALAACAPAATGDDPRAVPPLAGSDAIEAWFAAGHYLAWPCEAAPHDPVATSPHGRLRTCTNGRAMTEVDAAVVAELVDDAGAIAGYGAQRRTTADGWYWYMRVPAGNATAHDATGLAADGWDFEPGPVADYCEPCHRAVDNEVFVPRTTPGHRVLEVTR